MKTHALKCAEKWFQEVWDLKKTFEVRDNDRSFGVGDRVLLREWNNVSGYSGRTIEAEVTYIFGYDPSLPLLQKGTVVMSINVRTKCDGQ